YVLPKRSGWLGGLSYSPNAEDGRFDRLVQLGFVHETYWHQNIWRWGGTYAHARANVHDAGTSYRDLNSVSLGTSVSLNDSVDLAVSGSYAGTGGAPPASNGRSTAVAWGVTASLNYNSGPWTLGGYYQLATQPETAEPGTSARLSAFELGASYRFTTRLRFYGAWFIYHLSNQGRSSDAIAGSGSVVMLGVRAAL